MKKFISILMIIAILAININTFYIVIATTGNTNNEGNVVETNEINIKRIADNSTVDDYKKIITNTEQGSRDDGNVWIDKSVYSQDDTNTITLDDKFEIKYNEDFLNVFSALGSSQQIYGGQASPLDVVLLLDVSTSMTCKGQDDGTYAKIDEAEKVIAQANKLIKTLMKEDESKPNVHEDNRVGVVAFAGGSQVLLPLDHYTSLNSEDYLTMESNKVGTKYWPQITTSVKVDGKEFTNKTSQYMFADSTYLQGALYQGMHMLATEENTTYTNPINGKEFNRTPVLIVLTDGGTNIVGATSTKENSKSINWWDPLSWVEGENANFEAIIPSYYSNPSDYRYFVPVPNGNPFYVRNNKRKR